VVFFPVRKQTVSLNFDIKDMREASYVLGIEIHKDKQKRVLGLTEVIYRKCTKDV
jgi:hypothetical protein